MKCKYDCLCHSYVHSAAPAVSDEIKEAFFKINYSPSRSQFSKHTQYKKHLLHCINHLQCYRFGQLLSRWLFAYSGLLTVYSEEHDVRAKKNVCLSHNGSCYVTNLGMCLTCLTFPRFKNKKLLKNVFHNLQLNVYCFRIPLIKPKLPI